MAEKLTEEEAEFVSEMKIEPTKSGWSNFDPPFLRRAVRRFEKRGWIETRYEGRFTEHRFTEAGRGALKGPDHEQR